MDDEKLSICTERLRREFGDVTALDGVDIEIDGPQIIGVAGPNGSGKTSFIRTLLGLLKPNNGRVTVNGTEPLSFDSHDRTRLGYMPQHEAVYRDLTVRENVDFFARLYRLSNREQAVDSALEFVDLKDREDARIGELSGGMIRRVSLACAIVHEPDVLFLDEPTVGLDPELRANMWEGFREMRDEGTLAMVSTHYLGETRNCDRVLFLRNGSVLAFDSPQNYLERTETDNLESAFLALLDYSDQYPTSSVSNDRVREKEGRRSNDEIRKKGDTGSDDEVSRKEGRRSDDEVSRKEGTRQNKGVDS